MSYFTSTDESDMESQGSDYSFSKRHRKGRKYGQVIDSDATNANDILNILRSRIAFLSGGVDKRGGPVITFPAQARTQQEISITELTSTILYLSKIPSDDSRRHGFTVIIDVRGRTSKLLKPILRSLQACLVGQVYMVCVIRPDSFVERQKSNVKVKDKSLSFEVITMNGTSKLHRYVANDQLTSDLHGNLAYDHDNWVEIRVALEAFRKHAVVISQHFDEIEMQLARREIANDVPDLEYLIQQHRNFQAEVFDTPMTTINEGKQVLVQLRPKFQKDQIDAHGVQMTPDQINMLKEAKLLSEQLEARHSRLQENWHEWDKTLSNYLTLAKFNEGFKEVMAWVKNSAEPYFDSSNDIGDSYASVQTVKDQHDRFELVAREMLQTYQDLLNQAANLLKGGHYASAEIQSKAEHMKFSCIAIQSNLERRRKLINASINFHEEAVNLSHCLDEQFKLAAAYADEDDLQGVQEMMRVLQEKGDSISLHFDGVHSQGKTIMRILQEPVVSSSGESKVSDTKDQQWYITQRIAALEDKKARCNEILDNQKSKLKQYQQLWSYRQDTDDTIAWLQELCFKLRSNINLGKNVKISKELQNENEKFEFNAKDSYKYAMDTLSTAMTVRNSGEYEDGPTKIQQEALDEIWGKFTNGVTERASRLAVAIMLHHKLDQALRRLYAISNKLKNANEKAKKNYSSNHIKRHQQLVESISYNYDSIMSIGKALTERIRQPVIRIDSKMTIQEKKNMKKAIHIIEKRLLELQHAKHDLQEIWDFYYNKYSGLRQYNRFNEKAAKLLLWIEEKNAQIRNKMAIACTLDAAKSIYNKLLDVGNEIKSKNSEIEKALRVGQQHLDIFQEQSSQYQTLVHDLEDSWENLKTMSINWSNVIKCAVNFHENIEKLHRIIEEAEKKASTMSFDKSSNLNRQLKNYDEIIDRGGKYVDVVSQSSREILNLIENLQQQMQVSDSPIKQTLSSAKERYDQLVQKRNIMQRSLEESEMITDMRSDIKQLQLFIDGTVGTLLSRNTDYGRKLARIQQFEKLHLNIQQELESNNEKYQKINSTIGQAKMDRNLDLSTIDEDIDKLKNSWPECQAFLENRIYLTQMVIELQNKVNEMVNKCNDLLSQSKRSSQSTQGSDDPLEIEKDLESDVARLKNKRIEIQKFLSKDIFDSYLDGGAIMEAVAQVLADLEDKTAKAKVALDTKNKMQKSNKVKDDLKKALQSVHDLDEEVGKVSMGEDSSSVEKEQEKLKGYKFKLSQLKQQVEKCAKDCTNVSAGDVNRLLDDARDTCNILAKNLSSCESMLGYAKEFFLSAEEYEKLVEKSREMIRGKPKTTDLQHAKSIISTSESAFQKLATAYDKVCDNHAQLCESVNYYQEQPNSLELITDGIQQLAEDFTLHHEEISEKWSDYHKELEASLEVSALEQVLDKIRTQIDALDSSISQKEKVLISTLHACKRARNEFEQFQEEIKETEKNVERLTDMAADLETSNADKAEEIDTKAEDLEKRWQEFIARAEKYNFTLSLLSQFYEYCNEGDKWIRDTKKMIDDFGDKIPKRPGRIEATKMLTELMNRIQTEEIETLFIDIEILAKYVDVKPATDKAGTLSKRYNEIKRDGDNLRQQLELLKEGKIRGLWKLTSAAKNKANGIEDQDADANNEDIPKRERSPSNAVKDLLEADPAFKSPKMIRKRPGRKGRSLPTISETERKNLAEKIGPGGKKLRRIASDSLNNSRNSNPGNSPKIDISNNTIPEVDDVDGAEKEAPKFVKPPPRISSSSLNKTSASKPSDDQPDSPRRSIINTNGRGSSNLKSPTSWNSSPSTSLGSLPESSQKSSPATSVSSKPQTDLRTNRRVSSSTMISPRSETNDKPNQRFSRLTSNNAPEDDKPSQKLSRLASNNASTDDKPSQRASRLISSNVSADDKPSQRASRLTSSNASADDKLSQRPSRLTSSNTSASADDKPSQRSLRLTSSKSSTDDKPNQKPSRLISSNGSADDKPSQRPSRISSSNASDSKSSQKPSRFPSSNASDDKPSQRPSRFSSSNASDNNSSQTPSRFSSSNASDDKPSQRPSRFSSSIALDSKSSQRPSPSPSSNASDDKPSQRPSRFSSSIASDSKSSQRPSRSPSSNASDDKPSQRPSRFSSSKASDDKPSQRPSRFSPSNASDNKSSQRPSRSPSSNASDDKPNQRPSRFSSSNTSDDKQSQRPSRFSSSIASDSKSSQRPSRSPSSNASDDKPSQRPSRFSSSKASDDKPSQRPSRFSSSIASDSKSSQRPSRSPSSNASDDKPSQRPSRFSSSKASDDKPSQRPSRFSSSNSSNDKPNTRPLRLTSSKSSSEDKPSPSPTSIESNGNKSTKRSSPVSVSSRSQVDGNLVKNSPSIPMRIASSSTNRNSLSSAPNSQKNNDNIRKPPARTVSNGRMNNVNATSKPVTPNASNEPPRRTPITNSRRTSDNNPPVRKSSNSVQIKRTPSTTSPVSPVAPTRSAQNSTSRNTNNSDPNKRRVSVTARSRISSSD